MSPRSSARAASRAPSHASPNDAKPADVPQTLSGKPRAPRRVVRTLDREPEGLDLVVAETAAELTDPATAVEAPAVSIARRVLDIEAQALTALARRVDASFARAVTLLDACKGRVVVTGVGKSGHIARKIAATFASTGTPAFFVHAAEAKHGDLGMITAADCMVAISYGGESEELLGIMPIVKRDGTKLIAITGRPDSSLARLADVHLDAHVEVEACPNNLAPTASTTAALALGDALAVALLEIRGFTADDFARSHPGGSLGRRLLTHVADVMRTGAAVPAVGVDASLLDAILEISKKGIAMTAVVDPDGRIAGVFTDGDLRRMIERGQEVSKARVADVMHRGPRTIAADRLAAEAADLMEQHRINQLLVTGPGGELVGALHIHDLTNAKVI
jgi:arabinose-5-phosphate isomerase